MYVPTVLFASINHKISVHKSANKLDLSINMGSQQKRPLEIFSKRRFVLKVCVLMILSLQIPHLLHGLNLHRLDLLARPGCHLGRPQSGHTSLGLLHSMPH
jgi:hypothetical protein